MTEEEWEKKETERLEEEKIRHELCYTTVEGQHRYCPWGEETWCKWHKLQQEKDKDKEDTDEDEEDKKKEENEDKEKALANKGLPYCFYDLLKPIYDRFSDEKLLERCKDGYTQNQNESFHSMIWNHALKHKFFG